MENTYERIRKILNRLRYTPLNESIHLSDIEFMIEESISDGDLSSDEYHNLKSDLDCTVHKRNC